VQSARIKLNFFENCGTTFSKPRNRLGGCGKPSASGLQIVKQLHVEVVPQSLGSDTPIMPVDGDSASQPSSVVQNGGDALPGLPWGKVQAVGIKQCGVHYVKRKFEHSTHL
jgi:hypothetical protein